MKLSIIIPVWNVEKYIVKCINSCLRIRGIDIELIVVNDGSPDNTITTIKNNFGELPNLFIYSTENKGLSAARNYGIEKSTGDYILFVDADDWIRTDINNITENRWFFEDIDVLFFEYQIIDEIDERRFYPVRPYPVNLEKKYSGEDIFKLSMERYASSGFDHFAWLGIYKKEFLINNNIKFSEGLLYEDYDFWFNVMRHAKKIRYSHYICYSYRLRYNSITHCGFSEKLIESIFFTIKKAIDIETATQPYLACVGANLELMIVYSELRTSTKKLDYFEQNLVNKTITQKREIIDLIDKKYPETSYDWIKIKYRLISNIIFCFGIYCEDMLNILAALRNKIVNQLEQSLDGSNLFKDHGKVGLFGHGPRSDITLSTYEELFGKTKAYCVYVDSNVESYKSKHYNRDIININDLKKEKISEVVICTNYYEEAMRNAINERYPDIKIYSPYKDSHYSLMWVFCNNYFEIYKRLKETELKKRIILFLTPEYPNVGDHLIAVSEKEFLAKYFPDYEVIDITNDEYAFYKCRIKKMIKKEDILAITGGGFFGGLWKEFHYDQALDIISGYPENKVWVFPQSVYFEQTREGDNYKCRTFEAFKRDNLKVVCRENFSFNALSALNIDKKSYSLFPDIALFHQFSKCFPRRESIGIFLRFDKESILDKKDRYLIDTVLVYSGLELIHSSMQYGCVIRKQEREQAVEEKLEEISRYRLVVTDQLHCMLSCVITKTPCIAFNNISRKLEGVYSYLTNLHHIRFLSNANRFEENLNDLLNLKSDDYLRQRYEQDWNKMAQFFLLD